MRINRVKGIETLPREATVKYDFFQMGTGVKESKKDVTKVVLLVKL